ncbi:ABC-2 type transport system ATP-binding protein [Lipingzhangella halophila]|uniref:ABC-2 type transport system ATP-binding protein n=1 Tax=Lipingzhangella halophila TaxID=1783352 RepID=A0A7W7W345_9ACTN|nr:ABC transporter ATP-binding protein [Lipingzhangella halophila]MBB4932401.1 ABC-2 type transport system ATP-binding protein [Lipingzhangella halophila]
METAAVEATDLVKRYGDTTAVAGLAFRAPRGAVTALLGPNGAGKTSTVEICEGFRRADSGRVRVLGLDPASDAAALKPRVGVMLQSGGAPTGARTGEWLRLMASFHAHPIPAQDLLERLGIASTSRTPVRRLSGGQQQRLSLAAAVIGRPELVFLDEPTAGLDPQARMATWDLVAQLRAAGVGVVLTTHHMEEAERLADHVVIIDDGRVVADGSASELTDSQQELRFYAEPELDTASLLAALPPASGVTAHPSGRRTQYVVVTGAPGGLGPGFVATVTTWCAANSVLPEELRVQRRTLEDVFLELTGRDLRDS